MRNGIGDEEKDAEAENMHVQGAEKHCLTGWKVWDATEKYVRKELEEYGKCYV